MWVHRTRPQVFCIDLDKSNNCLGANASKQGSFRHQILRVQACLKTGKTLPAIGVDGRPFIFSPNQNFPLERKRSDSSEVPVGRRKKGWVGRAD